MADLFELFVAEWMRLNLPDQFMLKTQERVEITETKGLHFAIDMVIDNLETGQPQFVLDTKYKAPDSPSTTDLQQIIAYAQVKGCHEAILVYPKTLETALDYDAKDIRVRTMVFDLAGDLEEAGRGFLALLLG
jgi:5-methylcytosine-specific restriction enzyme subunit McrC